MSYDITYKNRAHRKLASLSITTAQKENQLKDPYQLRKTVRGRKALVFLVAVMTAKPTNDNNLSMTMITYDTICVNAKINSVL